MSDTSNSEEYRVLARKYRPQSFETLIGQDALVRTLKNAIDTGRIAHAFMLTGVRGVGKTTTARIIAKALNHKGADGDQGPTTQDTSACPLCQAITEDRHPDVIEMDAASRTGIDDIREILEGVRYAPTEARYKVYIIDEVHMLSKQAFNALLKTLEEPPAHVKFIFATTEIRKVPITVLSRCQRFDLRRVDVPTLAAHFSRICTAENVTAEDPALELIARAADGSVRDGLSILDQAISTSAGNITPHTIHTMLGMADSAATLDLLDHALHGRTQDALSILDRTYAAGSDPLTLMQDALGFVHILSRLRAVPEMEAQGTLSPDIMARAKEMSTQLSMPSLSKAWQLLLKSIEEIKIAPMPQAAAEMGIIRLTYAANLPDPVDLIKTLNSPPPNTRPPAGPDAPGSSTPLHTASSSTPLSSPPAEASTPNTPLGVTPLARAPHETTSTPHDPITSLEDIVRLLERVNEVVLASVLSYSAEPVKVSDALLEIGLRDGASPRIKDLQKTLSRITGNRWIVSFVAPQGLQTLDEKRTALDAEDRNNILQMPIIRAILDTFEEAELTALEPHKADNT